MSLCEMQQSEAYIIVASLKHPKVTFHVTLSIARLVPGVVMTISILTSSAGERQHQHRQTSLCGQHWAGLQDHVVTRPHHRGRVFVFGPLAYMGARLGRVFPSEVFYLSFLQNVIKTVNV